MAKKSKSKKSELVVEVPAVVVEIPTPVETPAVVAEKIPTAKELRHSVYLQARKAKLSVLQAAQVSYAHATNPVVPTDQLIAKIPTVAPELWAAATPKTPSPAVIAVLLENQ